MFWEDLTSRMEIALFTDAFAPCGSEWFTRYLALGGMVGQARPFQLSFGGAFGSVSLNQGSHAAPGCERSWVWLDCLQTLTLVCPSEQTDLGEFQNFILRSLSR